MNEKRKIGKTMRSAALMLAALTVFAAVLAGCKAKPAAAPAAKNQAGSQPKIVETAKVGKVQIAGAVMQSADVLPNANITVASKTNGDVLAVVKHKGDRVQAGDVLVKLDPTDAKLQEQKAELAVQSAQQALDSGRTNYQNQKTKLEQALASAAQAYNKMKNDYDQGLVDKSQLDQAANAYTNTKNQLDALKESSIHALEIQLANAKVSLKQAQRQLDFYQIKAPINGVLTAMNAEKGMSLNAGFQAGQIEQLDPAKIKALLTPDSAKLIQGKKELPVIVPGQSQPVQAKVSYLSDIMDTRSGTYELELLAENGNTVLKPGMKVQVQLTTAAQEKVLAVPTLSIVREGSDNYVFIVQNGHAVKRKVTIGRVNGLNQEILSGVQEGESLVVSGQNQLKDQDKVKVQASGSAGQ